MQHRVGLARLLLVGRLVLGGVLLYAGAVKLPRLEESITAVRAYQLLPLELATLVGRLLPVVEVVVGLCLLLGLFTRVAAAVGSLLMAAFVVGIASVWVRHIPIECGCFGDGGTIAWEQARAAYPWEIARDAGLLLVGALLVWRPRTPAALDNRLFPPPSIEKETPHVEVRP